MYFVHDGGEQLSVDGFGAIQPGKVIGTSIHVGSVAEISDLINNDIHKVSLMPDTSDVSTKSSPHEGTQTMQNNSPLSRKRFTAFLPTTFEPSK